jgi:hypothetical protein
MTSRDEHTLMFENRVQRRDEVMGELRKIRNEEHRNVYYLPS